MQGICSTSWSMMIGGNSDSSYGMEQGWSGIRLRGEFPVDKPIFMPQDLSVHHCWKNLPERFYDIWNDRKKSRRTPDGFFNG